MSNNLAGWDVSNENEIKNTNSENLEFCFDNGITNKSDINKVMNKSPCKIYEESEE